MYGPAVRCKTEFQDHEPEMRHSRSPKRSRSAQPRAKDPALASDYPSSTEERNRRAFQDYYFGSCLD